MELKDMTKKQLISEIADINRLLHEAQESLISWEKEHTEQFQKKGRNGKPNA